jgi:hypothetical protein
MKEWGWKGYELYGRGFMKEKKFVRSVFVYLLNFANERKK